MDEFKKRIFAQILPNVLNKCADRIKNKTKNKTQFEDYLNLYSDKLRKTLKIDTELQFIINYSLMKDNYKEDYFKEIENTINIFFSEETGEK